MVCLHKHYLFQIVYIIRDHSTYLSIYSRLAGNAAIKAKNVCLHLVDEHEHITESGLVQLFTYPHPAKYVNQSLWAKAPPKLYSQKQLRPSMYHLA